MEELGNMEDLILQVKKHTIQISVILMVLSFIALTILQFGIYPDLFKDCVVKLISQNTSLLRDYLIIINGGIFTSTFVTLNIAIREYKDTRRETLIEYYNISNNFLKNFRNIQYFYFDYPIELVKSCFEEAAENECKNIFNTQIEQSLKKSGVKKKRNKKIVERAYNPLLFEEKEKMKIYIWNNEDEETKCRLLDEKLKNQYLEDEYKAIMQKYYIKINDVMKQYIEIKKCNYNMVENAFGKIDFIFMNKKIRKEFIYAKLHDRQRAILHKIVEEAMCFEQYYKNNKNIPEIIDKIIIIQKELFEIREVETGYVIYKSYCYEIDRQLSDLLSIIYGKGYKKIVPKLRNYCIFSKIDVQKFKEANERLDRENFKIR